MSNFLAQSFPKKTAGSLMLFLLLTELIIGGILLPYRQAQAVVDIIGGPSNILNLLRGVVDDVYDAAASAYESAGVWAETYLQIDDKVEKALKEALKWAFTALKKKLLDMMVDQIITWINGGGKPTFVTDWRAFLSKAIDDVGGNFVSEYLGAAFLCKNISPQIQIMLAKPKTFNTTAACTLSKIGTNLQNFFANFTTGGWKGWLAVSETQNNIYGMYFYAQDQKWSMEELAAKTGSTAAAAGAGFLGDQVCLRYYKFLPDGEGELEKVFDTKSAPKKGEAPQPFTDANCTEWFTRTPGKVAADSLSKVVGKDYDWLLQSKEYSEYVVAIADAVINRMIKEGIALIASAASSSGSGSVTIDYSTVMGGVADYQDATESKPYVEQIIPQAKLLKENLGKVIIEYQANLVPLNQVSAIQRDAFNTLKNIAQENCPIPGGANLQDLGTQVTSNCNNSTCPCQIKTINLTKASVPSFGDATFKVTTIEDYTLDQTENTCSQLTMAKTTNLTIGALSADAEISSINNAILNIQTKMNLVDPAVTDLENYLTSIDNYNTSYDAAQFTGTKVASSTIDAMYSAKQKAINSTKAIINSQSTKLKDFTSELSTASQSTATTRTDILQKRGADAGGAGCSYSTGYYKTLCDIKATKAAWDSAYTSCLDARNNNY